MIEVLDFMFQSFWVWLGCAAILYIITNFIVSILNTYMCHRTVRKVGYPPSHCVKDDKEVFVGDELNNKQAQ